jgi:bla regulator protein blaR1
MLATLARASVDGAVLVAIVWAMTRLLRLSAAARTFLWWCVAAKFVVALIWIDPVAIPVLSESSAGRDLTTTIDARPDTMAGRGVSLVGSGLQALGSRLEDPMASVESLNVRADGFAWAGAALAIWIAGFLIASIGGVSRWREIRAALRESSAADETTKAMLADLAGTLGLRQLPDVRVSSRVDTPLVAGLTRTVVLLPTDRFDRLEPRQQRMALCHELAHLKRADLWLGWVPALAERAFFFHPLVHLAAREYALWREAACDQTVLEALDATPREYGRLLLDLGVARPHAGLAAAGASWSFQNLKRRITMLHEVSTRSKASRVAGAAAVALSVAAIVPMQLVARPSTSVAQESALEALSAAQGASDPQQTPKASAAEKRTEQPQSDFNYVFIHDESTTTSGSKADVARARRFKRPGEPLVWFRRGGQEYVIRDPQTVRQIQEVWRHVHEFGAEHEKFEADFEAHRAEFEKMHADIAKEHARMAAQQEKFEVHQPDFDKLADFAKEHARIAEQALIDSRIGELASRDIERAFREADELQSTVDRAALELNTRIAQEDMQLEVQKLRAEIDKLSEQIRLLVEPLRHVTEPMEAWGKDMEGLARQMAEGSHKAEQEMLEILERALKSGLAEVVR